MNAKTASKLKARLAVAAGEPVAGFTNMNKTMANTRSAIEVRMSFAVTEISLMCETLERKSFRATALFCFKRLGPFGFGGNLLAFSFSPKEDY